MARVCTGCGLTVDGSGNLIAKTSGSWPYAPTVDSAASATYCSPTSGELFGAPEKFHLSEFVLANQGSGAPTQLNVFGATVGGPAVVITGDHMLTVTNPSPVLPMTLKLRAGILRAAIDVYGTGKTECLLFTKVAATGSISFAATDLGGNGRYVTFTGAAGADKFTADSQWDVCAPQFYTLPAAGSATFTINGWMQLVFFNGNSTISLGNFLLDVEGWN